MNIQKIKRELIKSLEAKGESNLVNHAIHELNLLIPEPEPGNKDPAVSWDQLCKVAALQLIMVFSAQGHSGMSAGYVTKLAQKLMSFEPLLPLTGEDDEWNEVGGMWQNKRCSQVFKDADGRAYNIEGRVFREPSGACFTTQDPEAGLESRVYVDFPYVPKTEYVDIPERK